MKKILFILTALTVSAAAFAEKITTVAEITSGNKYYIGATTGDKDSYFYVDGSAKTESIKGVAKEDVADAVALTFTAVTSGWTIKFDNGLYLGIKNAKDNGAVQVMEEPVVWTIDEDTDKGLLKLHPNDYYLQKNNSGTPFGSYKANQTNVWLESAGSAPVLANLDSLVIKGKAEKMEYELGEAFDPAGLEVWGIYTKTVKHDSISQIKSGITWTLDPETFEWASDNASVTIVASYKELTTADTTITHIKVNAVVPAPVARKEFSFVAGEAADSDPAMFAITWGDDGSSETVQMTKKEDAIYVAEILTTVDSVVLVRCATGATDIIWDGEGKNVWNQTANYPLSDTMYFGEWTEEGLFTLTTEAPKPVEAKYYAKNNWNGEDWTWKEMTKSNENVYTLDRVVFGGTGVNINTKEEDTDAKWFDLEHMTYVNGKTIQAMDTVRFDLTISQEDTVLTATLLGRPAPVARKEFSFVAGEAADSDPAMFAITWGNDGSNETVQMTNKEDDIYVAEILTTVDSVVLVRCATGATEIIWDGEGKNVWNQTANYPLSDTMYFGEWTEEGLFTLTNEAPKPVEAKYYAKNNWNGEDWTWKEMTKSNENVYTLDRVVFGGTGVNINTKEEDADAKWFDLKKMTHVNDTIQKMDTVRFDLTISQKDTVLTATLLGRPAPVARKEFSFVAGAAAEGDPVMFAITWGADGSNETVKMSKKEDAIYVAEILTTVDSLVLVRCAAGATKIIWDGEGKNVWNQTANYPLSDTMYFGEWTEEGLFTLTTEAPKPAPKVDKTGITINGRKYSFPVRMVNEVE